MVVLAAKRIVVIGPESTGKSTLSAALAKVYNTLWVPEYAREYLLQLGRPYTEDDLQVIANGQTAAEDGLSAQCNKLLICDTDLNVIKVWSEHSYNRCHSSILEQISTRHYDMYLLTYIDTQWEYDELREHSQPEMRRYFYDQYRDIVMNSGVPWHDIRGTHEQRLQTAMAAINALLA